MSKKELTKLFNPTNPLCRAAIRVAASWISEQSAILPPGAVLSKELLEALLPAPLKVCELCGEEVDPNLTLAAGGGYTEAVCSDCGGEVKSRSTLHLSYLMRCVDLVRLREQYLELYNAANKVLQQYRSAGPRDIDSLGHSDLKTLEEVVAQANWKPPWKPLP